MPELNEIADLHEKRLLSAFFESVRSVKSRVLIKEIVALLERGDVNGVVNLLQLDDAAFEPLEEAIRQAYREGGLAGVEQIGSIPTDAGNIAVRFSMRSLRAERWLREMSSRLITEIFEEQRQMVRERLTDALARGQSPRQSALDLVGRVDAQTGERTGGFIGLTSRQAQWVANARSELESLDGSYFTRELRDKRFDASVRKAIRDERALSAEHIIKIISRMQARTLRYRGQVISSTESINALRAGQFESIKQAAERGGIPSSEIRKSWDATGDARTRTDHLMMEQTQKNLALDELFRAPDGSLMMYPGDTTRGATGAQVIQCRCSAVYEIDFRAQLKRLEGF